MDQHPDNPIGNRLPDGVEETELIHAVKVSGYPLQSLVAQDLSTQFEVVEEWGYTDRTTQEHRSLDIYAFYQFGDETAPVRPELQLLVECKRSDLPFLFFTPGVQRVPWDFPEIIGAGRFSLKVDDKRTQDASPATFFCAADLPFVMTPRLAVTFTKAQRKGKQFELSGELPFNQVVMPLTSAVEHIRQVTHGYSSPPRILLSLCVVDSTMIVASGTPEAPLLELAPWVRVVHQESVRESDRWRWRNYAIDFVHREFLMRYVTEHAVPFATVLAARMVQYHRRHPKTAVMRPKNLSWDAFITS